MKNCDPCAALNCSPPEDFREFSLQGLPPQPPVPVVPTPVAAFGNDPVGYPFPCPGTITYSGALPAWISIDQTNQQLVGLAGTYRGNTKVAATVAAQNSLNAFAGAAITAGTLTCATVATCDMANTDQYAISGYVDGLVANPGGTPQVGGVVWDGTFKYKVTGNCVWYGMSNAQQNTPPYPIMDGLIIAAIFVWFNGTEWQLFFGNNNQEVWEGLKSSGTTPAGTYTNDNGGADGTPLTLTLVNVGGTALPYQ